VKDFAKDQKIEIELRRIVIETEDDAERHRFIGSPSVRIAGQDVDPAARSITQYGFS
jgi:hypothetical protein